MQCTYVPLDHSTPNMCNVNIGLNFRWIFLKFQIKQFFFSIHQVQDENHHISVKLKTNALAYEVILYGNKGRINGVNTKVGL